MASPDSTLLSWIAAEVNQALSVVREHLAKAEAQAGPEPLRACPDHLHQVSGALRMVGLNGATRFSESLEASLLALASGSADRGGLAVIDRAVLTLKEFVEGLERGQTNVPLRLFPVYRELAELQGRQDVSERELFYPDLGIPVPEAAVARALPAAELAPFVQSQRTQFQRGLLAWLRGQAVGLDDMAGALDALSGVAGQLPEPRALWWVAGALIELLASSEDAEWLAAAKPLCNRIDFHIRDLAAGAQASAEALLRDLLYAIAKAGAASSRAREVRQIFQLEGQVPGAEPAKPELEMNTEWLEAALYDMHSRLDTLKSAWVHYVSGEQKTAARFRELVASFKAKASELGNQQMIKLLDAIALVAKRLPDPYPAQKQYMIIEMASAFLLVENVIDHFSSPPADLDQQIIILGGWLLDSAEGKASGTPAGLRADLVQKIGALQLRAQVAKEILANLQHLEQVLDAFARDASKRESLAGLKPFVRQAHGALKILGLERAAEVISICENMIDACGVIEAEAAAEQMDWIAEGLSSVGFYLGPCLHGREPSDQSIELFFQRFGKRIGKAAPGSWMETTANLAAERPSEPGARPGVDTELLGIFLDEAAEVLERIESAVPLSREKPDDLEALTLMRRGFHTLKGSGRMVGLMDLGELAWEIEQMMNRWLEEKRPVSPGLLAFVQKAVHAFAGWIEALRAGRLSGEIHAPELVESARALKRGEEVAASPECEEITIGTTTLARSFFEIFIKEAAEHVATLEREFAAWRETPGSDTSQAFMRAAHTLASSSGTAGFAELATLAGAIEQWIPFARQATDEADAQALQAAVTRLREMTDALAQRQAPGEAGAQAASLKAITARLESSPPTLRTFETTAPYPAAHAIPRESRTQESGSEKCVMRDDIDEQLLPVFLEEALELVPAIGADLRDWKDRPADERVSQSLRRGLHTFKGSARMAGAIRLGELAHLMESRIEAAIEANAYPPELFGELEDKMDRMSGDVERLRAPELDIDTEAQAPEKAQARPGAMLRVNAEALDHLIAQAGEVSIARSRVEAELRAFKQSLSELGESVGRLRAQLREVEVQADSQMQSRLSVLEERSSEYDPLEFDRYTRLQELTRLMAEGLNDVISIQQGLARNIGESDAALLQQARIAREVQQRLMRMRAVPFSSLNERLYRTVRQAARELDKLAELEIEGAEVELDRSVLERIAAPLEHMLRNAVAHGIEPSQARTAAGKPEVARIVLALRQEASEIALVLSDDGAGIDVEKLYRRALEKGLVAPGTALEEAERVQLIFASGLSTAESVSELAGRGVGMDVVRSEIAAIGGRVEVTTARGRGTTFTVYLPLTLAVTQAVLVRSGERLFALSTAMVEQVLRLKADLMPALYEARQIEFQGVTYPLHSLRSMLQDGSSAPQAYNSVLLLRSGIQRIALHVDELVGNQEIVVKNVGPQLARMAWVGGATVLADGGIAPIINPVVLAGRQRGAALEASLRVPTIGAPAERKAAAPVVMVVDDSLTVRKVTSRLLEREGYQVLTAKDGLDALEQLRETLPAVMLVDIEMPRMDGFDLARNVRGDPRTRAIPIIMISSRTAEKHRSQAAELGVNAFLGKPYQEAELLAQIGAYVGTALA